MLSESDFLILKTIYTNPANFTQRELSSAVGFSLGKVNKICNAMIEQNFLEKAVQDGKEKIYYKITAHGKKALDAFKADNAIIMAAGLSSRFAPLSYEKPKCLLEVKGEILIERQIRQLREAGINDITVVVGYMKEKLFYLADKFGVSVVVNSDYYRYNNPSTLMCVASKLKNTFIIASDLYFAENVFEKYNYKAYYGCALSKKHTDEFCIEADKKNRINKVIETGGTNTLYMCDYAYFDTSFSKKFTKLLKAEYDNSLTKTQLWESFLGKHLDELEIYVKENNKGVVYEFDSLDELRKYDTNYINNIDSHIFENIKNALKCSNADITDFSPIKSGMTNTSFSFSCKGKKYVYRHPGPGTEKHINRKSEAYSMTVAQKLGIDKTFICMDATEGWKLSFFIDGAAELDYHDEKSVREALSILRKLHKEKGRKEFSFDIAEKIELYASIIENVGRDSFSDYSDLYDMYKKLYTLAEQDNFEKCLCHNDSYSPNFLIGKDGSMNLIDWEYSGVADPASDIGVFVACSDYTETEAIELIEKYLDRKPTEKELRHYIAYFSIVSYHWFLWALYQESVGKATGEFLLIWYRYAKQYGTKALELYNKN